MKKNLFLSLMAIAYLTFFYSSAFADAKSKKECIETSNTVLLRDDGGEIVLKVKIAQIAKKDCSIICDTAGAKLYAFSDASRMCVGSGIIDSNGMLEIVYNNPFRKRGKDWVYVERLYFIAQKGETITGYGAPDPAHPCFTGQYDYTHTPALIDRTQPIDPDRLAISFILPFCFTNTAVEPVPNGVPWNLLGPQKKAKVKSFAESFIIKDP